MTDGSGEFQVVGPWSRMATNIQLKGVGRDESTEGLVPSNSKMSKIPDTSSCPCHPEEHSLDLREKRSQQQRVQGSFSKHGSIDNKLLHAAP